MLTKLGIYPFALVAQIINFLILFFLLSKFLYKPLLKMIDERKRKISEGLENSKKIKEEIEQLEEKRLEKTEAVKKEATEIIQRAENAADKLRRETLEKAKKDALAIRKQAMLDFEEEKKKMLADIKAQTAWLVLETTKGILKKSLGSKEQRALVKEVLKDMEEIKPSKE